MQIVKFKDFPHLNETQIRTNFEEIWTFLQAVHHDIDPKWNEQYSLKGHAIDLAVEIRALRSDKEGNRYYKPHYIFRFSDKEKERFWKWYFQLCKVKKRRGTNEEYVIPHCLFHSVFSADLNTPPINDAGDISKTKLAKNTAHCTSLVAIDLDDVTHERYLELKKQFTDVGLYSIDLFSGHGYQMSFVLDTPSTDLTILKKFAHLVHDSMKIEEVDTKAVDCGRILRCGGYNSKGGLKGDKHFGEDIIKTQLVATTNERYNVSELFKRCGGEYVPNKRPLNVPRFRGGNIEDYLYLDEHEGNLSREARKHLKELNKVKKDKSKDKTSEIQVLDLNKLYPSLNIDQFPEGMKNMLYGFVNGYADNTLLFLTLRLKKLGYSEDVVISSMKTLATLDTFKYAWDVDIVESKVRRFYSKFWKNVSQQTYEDLTAKFGNLDMDFSDVGLITKATSIQIPRSLFVQNVTVDELQVTMSPTVVSNIPPKAFTLWLAMLVEADDFFTYFKKEKVFSIKDLMKITGKAEKSTRQAIDALADSKVKLVDKKKGVCKKNKEVNLYFINKHPDFSKGYFKLSKSQIEALLTRVKNKEISERELMLYFYLLFRVGSKESVTFSHTEAANVFGLDRTSVLKVLNSLGVYEKRLLRIEKDTPSKMHNYILLR